MMQNGSSSCPKFNNQMDLLFDHLQLYGEVVSERAEKASVRRRDLEFQLLLHLPRLMSKNECLPRHTFVSEAERLAAILRERMAHWVFLLVKPEDAPAAPCETIFCLVPDWEAQIIHERFHYLASSRQESLHFGLRTLQSNRLMALATLSPFDLEHIQPALPTRICSDEIMVVSRVYCFPWTPENAISYLLSKVVREMQNLNPKIKLLVTYVNPNMGFNGASYKASNWSLLGYETGTRYAYLDDCYVTDRFLIKRFGTASPEALRTSLESRFKTSQVQLSPLILFAFKIRDRQTPIRNINKIYYFERP